MTDQAKDPKPNSELKIKKSLASKVGINLSLFEYRTQFDRADRPIFDNIMIDTARSFGLMYGLGASFSVIKAIVNFKRTIRNPGTLIKELLEEGKIRSGAFTAMMTFVMKTTIALLRIIRKKDDGLNGFVGGALGGYLSLFLLKTDKKVFIVLSLLSRAFDTMYANGANKGYYKRSMWHYHIAYWIMGTFLCNRVVFEPKVLDKGFWSSFMVLGALSKADKAFFYGIYPEITRRAVENTWKAARDLYLIRK